MSKRILVSVILVALVLMVIGMFASAAKKSQHSQSASESSEEDLSQIVVVPSEIPSKISMPVPSGFQETSSPYYNKYYILNDASIIVTGEELAIHGQNVDEYTENVLKQYRKTADDFSLLSDGTVSSGAPCRVLEFTYALIGEDVRQDFQCITAVLLKDDFAYIVTCKSKRETFGSYRGAFSSMIEHIVIADDSRTEGQPSVSDSSTDRQNGADFSESPQ